MSEGEAFFLSVFRCLFDILQQNKRKNKTYFIFIIKINNTQWRVKLRAQQVPMRKNRDSAAISRNAIEKR